jgi:hypothetical protein
MKKTNKYLFILWALGSLWIAGCNQTKTKIPQKKAKQLLHNPNLQ